MNETTNSNESRNYWNRVKGQKQKETRTVRVYDSSKGSMILNQPKLNKKQRRKFRAIYKEQVLKEQQEAEQNL